MFLIDYRYDKLIKSHVLIYTSRKNILKIVPAYLRRREAAVWGGLKKITRRWQMLTNTYWTVIKFGCDSVFEFLLIRLIFRDFRQKV